MKTELKYTMALIVALGFFSLNGFSQASDAPGLPYHVPAIMEIITDAVESPTDTNAFVGMLFEAQDFPAFQMGQPLSQEEFQAIEEWVSTHVSIMQEFQKERKRNYDKFYLNQQ